MSSEKTLGPVMSPTHGRVNTVQWVTVVVNKKGLRDIWSSPIPMENHTLLTCHATVGDTVKIMLPNGSAETHLITRGAGVYVFEIIGGELDSLSGPYNDDPKVAKSIHKRVGEVKCG